MPRDKDLLAFTTPDHVYGQGIDDLLRQRDEIERILRERFQRRVAVLFTDIQGSTRYFEQHGDLAGRAWIQRHNSLLCPVIEACGGRVVKTIGDAIMALFESAHDAVDAAVRMQQKLEEHNAGTPSDERIHVRIGVHYGEALIDSADIYGDTVNVAARVEAAAAADEILVSAAVRAQLGSDGPPVEDRGTMPAKGKATPIPIFSVRWQEMTRRSFTVKLPEVDPRYLVEGLIGVGGMATVWRARDRRLGRAVALKVLHKHLDLTPVARERFRREARIAAGLRHPNVVEVFDYSPDDAAESYIVMELVPGRSLRRFLEQHGALPGEAVAVVAHETARALASAHAAGIVHRDVKPDNILVSDDGAVKLGDFGIAGVTELARLTLTGAAIGTPAYMSPEQAEGKPADPRADVFALGVVLYECVTGNLPFAAPTAPAMMAKLAQGKYEDPTPRAGPLLARVITRALARDPAARYQDAAQMAKDLAAALEGMGIRDPRAAAARFATTPTDVGAILPSQPLVTTSPPVLPAGPRRWPWAVGIAAVATLAGIAVAIGTSSGTVAPPENTDALPPPKSPHLVEIAAAPAPAPVPVPVPAPGPKTPEPKGARPGAAPKKASPSPPKSAAEPAPAPSPVPVPVPAPPPVVNDTPPIPGPPPLPATGTLKVHVLPWADIYVDGVLFKSGEMDVELPLTPGRHAVKVVNPKLAREESEDVEIVAGKTLRKPFNLGKGTQ